MKDPVLDMADCTYSRGQKTDISERRKYGWLVGGTSNTPGKHYLRLTMIEPRETTEWKWLEIERTAAKCRADETRVGIRLHAGQVRRLRDFCDKWLACHNEWKGGAE